MIVFVWYVQHLANLILIPNPFVSDQRAEDLKEVEEAVNDASKEVESMKNETNFLIKQYGKKEEQWVEKSEANSVQVNFKEVFLFVITQHTPAHTSADRTRSSREANSTASTELDSFVRRGTAAPPSPLAPLPSPRGALDSRRPSSACSSAPSPTVAHTMHALISQ